MLVDAGDPGAASDGRDDGNPFSTRVTSTMRPSNVDPIAEACVMPSPTDISPRARRAAIRAERPVPVAERSRRPGATTTAFLVTSPTPRHGAAIWTMLTPAMAGFSGCTQGSCSRAAARIASPASEIACFVRFDLEAECLCVRDHVPHAAVGNVHCERSELFDLERRVEPFGEARDVRELDRLAAAVATRRARPRPRRPAPRAEGSSPALVSRGSPSRAGPSRCRSCSIPTSPDTRSAP